ncbi:MAG: metal-sulfur cluster assembly factor [Trueperaceae bacterium]
MTRSPDSASGPTEPAFTELRPAVPALDVLDSLRSVIDPELGLDVVDLGMVYAVTVVDGDVAIEMTLTTPGCPLHGSIEQEVRARLARLAGVTSVDVTLVWDPPWTPEAMHPRAKRVLGFG